MLTGAVLAGGRSLRYGRNKALEVFQGERLVDRAVGALRKSCSPVFLVANDLTPYLGVGANLLRDIVSFQGPLGGLYTALLFSPNDWVAVRATDMPLFVPEMLEAMLSLSAGGVDVVVPRSGDKYEPLFALYHRRCIPAIADVLEGPRRNVIGFFARVRVKHFEEDEWRRLDPDGLSFRNVNTPEDWSNL
ncbi:MAG: molybdenum cofactor guanylyltransferase [Syntrophobacteraceae bacterium]|nr:molybdenum cofactor guanylyltransferase [Syntrophobacteraceae bacterium]